MGRLQDKVAIVTGAAKGLGEAGARLFAAEGARVVLTDVDTVNGERVAAEIGSAARFRYQDVRDEAAWRDLIAEVEAELGRLDVLVNNAGVVEAGTIESTTAEGTDRLKPQFASQASIAEFWLGNGNRPMLISLAFPGVENSR